VISGDFDAAEAKKLVADYFANIPAQAPPKRPDSKESPRIDGRIQTVKDATARFPAVIVGWPAPLRHSPDWYALYMIDAVLTAGETARLKLNMMKGRLSLLQGESNLGFPAATPLDFKDPSWYAAILIYRPNFEAREIVDQYQNEIDRIVQDGVGRSELDRFKSVLRFERANSLQTALGRARLLGIHELMDGDAGFVEKDYASLLAVTSEQMQAAAGRYLTPGRRGVMAIQPNGGTK
jgi:zinc protease